MFHRSVPIHLSDLLIAEDMLHRFENGAQNPEGNERASSITNNSKPFLCSVSHTQADYFTALGLGYICSLREVMTWKKDLAPALSLS